MGQAQGRPSKEPKTQLPRTLQADQGMTGELNVTITGFVCRSDAAADRPIKFKRAKLESLPCAVRVEICGVRPKSTTSAPSTNSDFLDARRLPCQIQQGSLELSNNEYEFRLQSFQPFQFDGRSLHLNHQSAKQPWKRSLATEYDIRLTVLFQEQSHFARALQHVGLEVPMEESYLGARILIKTDSPRQTRYGRAYLLRSEATVSTHLELVTDIIWNRSAPPKGLPSVATAVDLVRAATIPPLKLASPVNNGTKPPDTAANQLCAEARIEKAWDLKLKALCHLFGDEKILWDEESFCDKLAQLAVMATREDADRLLRQVFCSRKHVAFDSEYCHSLRDAPREGGSTSDGLKAKFKPASWYKDIELKDVEAAIAKRESERRKAAKFHQRNQSTIQEAVPNEGHGALHHAKVHDKNASSIATETKAKGEARSVRSHITPGPPTKASKRGFVPSSRHKAVVPETPESVEDKSLWGSRLKLSTDNMQAATKSNSDSAVELDKLPAKLHEVSLGAGPYDVSETESSTIVTEPARSKKGRPRKAKAVSSTDMPVPRAASSGVTRNSSTTKVRSKYGLPIPALTPYTVPRLDDQELSLFKSITMRRLEPGSQVVEYDEQIDETWYRMKLEQKINSATSISSISKQLMNMWNDQMTEEKLNGNKFLPAALIRFVTVNQAWLSVTENFQQFLRFTGELRRDNLVMDDTLEQCVNMIHKKGAGTTSQAQGDARPAKAREEWAVSCRCGKQVEDLNESIVCANPVR